MTPEERVTALYIAAVDAHADAVLRNIDATERAVYKGGPLPTPDARRTVLRLRLAASLIRECVPGDPPVGGYTTARDIAALLEADSALLPQTLLPVLRPDTYPATR